MGNPLVRAEAGRFPHRVAARIAGAIRSAVFRGEGGPSPAALRAASAREGLSPQPADTVRLPPTTAPGSEEDLAAALREAFRSRKSVVFRGGGTRSGLGRPVRPDLVLDLRRLSGILEHHRDDLTVEARAGTTVAELNAALAGRRQFLPLDPPCPERATLGGVIAAGDPGFRVVPGSRPRDLLLGLEALLADGVPVRCGGRVVKNVTGYELTKLFTGSLGTLGAITRVTLRLRAIPEVSRTVVAPLPVRDGAGEFAERVLALAATAPAAAAIAVAPPGTGLPGLPVDGGFRLAARFEGLAEEAAAAPTAFPGAGAEELPDDADFWGGVRDFAVRVPAPDGFCLLARGPRAGLLRTAWRLAALGPPLVLPDQRRALVAVPAGDFEAARAIVREEPGVRLTVETAPPGWKAGREVSCPSPPPGVRALSRRLKEALDPRGILAPGRLDLS